ncbi:sensor histidine kinase [Comamonas sp. J-3]|uniref:sensor histidine kinase n=1 Tax=Comamonas trifloxystrobinivorans TaxID=3350256 RepID=UPI003729FA18
MTEPSTPTAPGPARRPWSLAARIAVLALVPTLLATAALGAWLRYEVQASLYASMARTLEEKSQRITARLRSLPDGRVQEAAGSGDEFSAIFSGWYWQLSTPQAVAAPLARSRSLWDQADLVMADSAVWGSQLLQSATGPQNEPLLAQRFAVQLPGIDPAVELQVYGPAEAVQASLGRIDRILLTAAALQVLLLGGLVWLQLRVGLVPLKRLIAVIAGLRKGSSQALPATVQIAQLPLGPDLAPLQRELVALVEQNAQVVQRARSHAADLNHALKKPLSVLTAQAGSAASVPSAQVLLQATAMARLIDRYQARTHSDAVHAPLAAGAGQTVDVLACARQMLAMLRQLHQAQELDWQLQPEGEAAAWRWRGERADLEELLGNVLDNAGKWAASTVRLTLQTAGAGRLRLLVDDDGPGMTEAQMQTAGERGLRFDETVDGSGLGLAIAQQIASSYGGALQLRKSAALKGLQVQLELGGLLD